MSPGRELALRALAWLAAFAWPLAPAAASAAGADDIARVDSLTFAQRFDVADSLVRVALARVPLATWPDSLRALPWLVRHFELSPEVWPPGAVDSALARSGIAVAQRLGEPADARRELSQRARVAAARFELHLGRPRDAAADAQSLLARELPPRAAYAAWIVLARAQVDCGARDSSLASADSAVALASRPWANAYDRDWAASWRGYVLSRAGQERLSIPLWEAALPRLTSAAPLGHPQLVRLRLLYANALGGPGGRLRDALEEVRGITADLEAAGFTETISYAVLLGQLCTRERRLGELSRSRADGERALEVMARLLGEQNPEYAFVSGILGATLRDLGDLAGARDRIRWAVDVMSARIGPTSAQVAGALNGLGIVYRRLGQPDSALACLRRSAAIYASRHGPPDAEEQNTKGSIANVLGDLGRYAESAAIADSATRAMASIVGEGHHYVPALMIVLATAQRALHDDAGAEALLDTVATRRMLKFGLAHPDVEESLSELALTRAFRGEQTAAFDAALSSLRSSRTYRRLVLRGLDERSALAVLARRKWGGLDVAMTLATGSPLSAAERESLLDEVIRQRSLLFDELLSRQRESAGDSVSRARAGSLSRVRAEIASRVLSGGDRTRADVDSLTRLEVALESEFAPASGEAVARAAFAAGAGLPEVLAALPPRSALVSIVRYEAVDLGDSAPRWRPALRGAYAGFVTTPGGEKGHWQTLGNAAPIDSLVAAWLKAGSAPGERVPERDVRAIGRTLRARVFDPVLGAARDAERVYLVLDGALGLVDPGALPDDAGGYLLEHPQRLLRLTSERELAAHVAAGSTPARGLLAVGGVDYDATARAPHGASSAVAVDATRFTPCEFVQLHRYSSLPASGAEVAAAARRWSTMASEDAHDVKLLRGGDARERAFRALSPGRRCLHIATHGFALRDDCEAWSTEASAAFRTIYRSGIVLAGANERDAHADPSDDGLLTAGEVSTLDLAGVEWVCLSACESGLGDAVRGEGVQGLVRAFQIAGARQVVMTPWPVADETAAAWNDEFYSAQPGHSLSVSEAARSASLRLLQARRHAGQPTPPATWACFTVAGLDR